MPGPQPTPTEILKARGSWRGKVREQQGEPKVKVKAPTCPRWLSPEARQEWYRQVKQLCEMRILSESDRAVLAVYCDTWATCVRLIKTIKEILSGKSSLTEAAVDRQVELLEKRKEAVVKLLIQLADRFGFSPAARARVRVLEKDTAVDSDEEFFFSEN